MNDNLYNFHYLVEAIFVGRPKYGNVVVFFKLQLQLRVVIGRLLHGIVAVDCPHQSGLTIDLITTIN